MLHLPGQLAFVSITEERTDAKSHSTKTERDFKHTSRDLFSIQDTQKHSSPRQRVESLTTPQSRTRRSLIAHKPILPFPSSGELNLSAPVISQKPRRTAFSECSDKSGPTKDGMAGDWPRLPTPKPTRRNDGLFKLKVSAHLIKVIFEQPSQI